VKLYGHEPSTEEACKIAVADHFLGFGGAFRGEGGGGSSFFLFRWA